MFRNLLHSVVGTYHCAGIRTVYECANSDENNLMIIYNNHVILHEVNTILLIMNLG